MSINNLLLQFKLNNFKILSFKKISSGIYSKLDSDWNYKDVLHLSHVHKLVEPIHINIGKKHSSTLALQKIFFLKIPLPIFIYEDKPFSIIYYTVFGPYVILIHTTIEEDSDVTTTITTYHIASTNTFFSLFSPLIKFLLNRNYEILMKDDIPMRLRRGYLRSLGYTFKIDEETYDFNGTVNVTNNNVSNISPKKDKFFNSDKFNISSVAGQSRIYIGDSDSYGILSIFKNNELFIYHRMCHHEGACLDYAAMHGDNLICPWHGKSIKPIFRSADTNLANFNFQDLNYEVNFLEKKCMVTISKI